MASKRDGSTDMAKPKARPKARATAKRDLMEPAERVEHILTIWALPEAQAGALPLPVSDAALAAWRARYTPKFLSAIVEDGRAWEQDGKNVLVRARLIGALAAVYAIKALRTEVEPADALSASRDLDCGEQQGGALTFLAKWC